LVWKTKIDALVELLNTVQEQVIIWTTFRIEFEYLMGVLGKDTAFINGSIPVGARTSIIKDFNQGHFKRLVAQPECFKFGADFSKASCMIYFSQPNSAITRSQTEDRVVHLNKKNPVLIMDLLVKDTVDEDIHSAHNKKQAYSERLYALSKKYINR
jgi:superfamily II DNA or RNA helicase